MISELERDIRCILNYTNCGNDLLEYRDNCSLRYDALKKLSSSDSSLVKRNAYLNSISKMLDVCQKKDVENVFSELVKNNNSSDLEYDVNVSCKLGMLGADINMYEKVLEFAIQSRLKTISSDKILLDDITIETTKDGILFVNTNFKFNKCLEKVA